jgi:hypothetical protein
LFDTRPTHRAAQLNNATPKLVPILGELARECHHLLGYSPGEAAQHRPRECDNNRDSHHAAEPPLEPSGHWTQDERDEDGEGHRHDDGRGHTERRDSGEKRQNTGRGPPPATLGWLAGAHAFGLLERPR